MTASSPKTSTAEKNQEPPLWNLDDLYKSPKDPQLTKDLDALEMDAKKFQKQYQGAVKGLSGDALFEAIKTFEAIEEGTAKVQSYAYLLFATHTRDGDITRFFQSIEEKTNAISTYLLFFSLEINQLSDADLNQKMDSSLIHYKPWIRALRLYKDHELSEELERVFHEMSVPASQAWVRLHDESLAHLAMQSDEGETLTLSDVLNLLSNPTRERRAQGAKYLVKGLNEKASLLALAYNTLMKEKSIEDTWRKFPTPAASRHISNQLDASVVEALVKSVQAFYPRLSHRYYKLKSKLLGLQKMSYWDRNAPLFLDVDEPPFTWESAKDLVLSAYRDFSPEMAKIGAVFFEKNWIDARLYEGKDSGAFSHPTVPSAHPYILMNFYGKSRDVMTLAHELGHGIHQTLAKDKGFFMSDTPLTLAETASVFGEMLAFQRMLRTTTSPLHKKYLLSQKIEDMLNTVVRQVAFYLFEERVHNRRKEGELGLEDFGKIWMDTQREALGGAFDLDESYQIFWIYVSHFVHSPFYVYSYAFGDCLVNALYGHYVAHPEGFVEKYIDLLSAGGTKTYSEILKPFNMDAHDPGFWNQGLLCIERMIDELESLCVEK